MIADGTLRLAARLARQAGLIHPRDWVAVYESHSPYEWALQEVLARVEPWGDERADLRQAVSTAALLLNGVDVSEEERGAAVIGLANYLKINEPEQEVVSAATMRKALGDG